MLDSRNARFIPYGRHCIDEDDINAVAAVMRGDFLTTGPAVAAFENALREQTGASCAVVCANGTAALHLAMAVLDFAPGDVAIVPSITFAATANAVRYVGGEVIFADVDPSTGLMRAQHFEAALKRADSRKLRAVIPVLLGGQGADALEIAEIASKRGIKVVEDASHAIGGNYRTRGREFTVGACGHSDLTTFSFHPVKTVAMGEGGAVTTNSKSYARRLSRLRTHGIERDPDHFIDRNMAFAGDGMANPWYYELQELGFNYRATDIQCALGASQLRKLRRFVQRRAELVARYDNLLAKKVPAARPIGRTLGFAPGWHLYVVQIDFAALGRDRAEVMRALHERGIGTQVHYVPLHRQPYYRARYGEQSLPGAERYYATALSLPLFPDLKDCEQDRVVAALAEILHG